MCNLSSFPLFFRLLQLNFFSNVHHHAKMHNFHFSSFKPPKRHSEIPVFFFLKNLHFSPGYCSQISFFSNVHHHVKVHIFLFSSFKRSVRHSGIPFFFRKCAIFCHSHCFFQITVAQIPFFLIFTITQKCTFLSFKPSERHSEIPFFLKCIWEIPPFSPHFLLLLVSHKPVFVLGTLPLGQTQASPQNDTPHKLLSHVPVYTLETQRIYSLSFSISPILFLIFHQFWPNFQTFPKFFVIFSIFFVKFTSFPVFSSFLNVKSSF